MVRRVAATLSEQDIFLWFHCLKFTRTCQSIKSMETALVRWDINYSRLLKQIALNLCPENVFSFEVNLHIFSESARILISHSLTITKGLKYRICSQYFLFYRMSFFLTQRGKQLQTVLSRLRFTSTTLTWNDQSLFASICFHRLEGTSCKFINMRTAFSNASCDGQLLGIL